MNNPAIVSYDKRKSCELKQGYDIRPNEPWKSIIIHTTNGKIGTSFESEAGYLQRSKDVGAHFLVSKDNRIATIVPLTHQAYHAGIVLNNMYGNKYSIGIEVHYTPGEGEWTPYMYNALTWLVKTLPGVPIKTHRGVAFPSWRKKDPSGMTDTFFTFWSNNITKEWANVEVVYRANVRDLATTASDASMKLDVGKKLFAAKVTGTVTYGNPQWYLTEYGYVHASAVREL